MRLVNASPLLVGSALVVVSSAIFGSVGVVVNLAVAAGFALPLLLSTRYLAAAVVTGGIAVAKGELREGLTSGHGWSFVVGLVMLAQTGCLFAAMTRMDMALVLALHYTFPAFVLIAESVLARRLPTPRQATACATALAGVGLVVLSGSTDRVDPVGILLAGSSGLIYAFVVMGWSRVLTTVPSTVASAWQFAGLGVAWLGACLVLGTPWELPGADALGMWVGIVAFCSVLPLIMLSSGTALVGSVNASTLATVEPVVGAVLAAVLLGQLPSPLALVGASLIVAASLVIVAPGPRTSLRMVHHAATRAAVPLRHSGRRVLSAAANPHRVLTGHMSRRPNRARPAGRPVTGRPAGHPASRQGTATSARTARHPGASRTAGRPVR